MLSASARRQQQQLDPRALRGVPAYLYVLKNSGLKEGMVHIGLSRRGGWARALELNRDKNNVIPGSFECIFEARAQDSGSALESVFEILKHARYGRGNQDYFEIDEQSVKHIIERCIEEADKRFQLRFQQDLAHRTYRADSEASLRREHELGTERDNESENKHINKAEEVIREGIFKKALSWLS